jgi:hypothetical protein
MALPAKQETVRQPATGFLEPSILLSPPGFLNNRPGNATNLDEPTPRMPSLAPAGYRSLPAGLLQVWTGKKLGTRLSRQVQ